jgi:type IV secretory pathway TraG/TraD family ATPase VirD4
LYRKALPAIILKKATVRGFLNLNNVIPTGDNISEQALATAQWAKPADLANLTFKPGALWLGRAADADETPVGFTDDRHALIVAGNRSGKGTSAIVPNLCLWPGSIVVIDPKGENATVTAARRAGGSDYCDGLDQRTFVLDPFKAAQVPDSLRASFNPIDALDPDSEEAVDDAARIADALVVSQNTNDPFWDEQARSLIKGLILHVLTSDDFEGRRNLVTVRQLITSGDVETRKTLESMDVEDIPSAFALLFEGMRRNPAFHGIVSGSGETFGNLAETSQKTFSGVLSAAGNHTEFIDSLPMQRLLAETTPGFSLDKLKTDPMGVSIFLSLPQRFMNTHFRWLRMMVALTITEMEKVPGQPASGHRVLLALDEFAGLKKMEIIENAAAQIAGFGVKMVFIVQQLTQLKTIYKDNWEVFVGNAGTRLFFGVDDNFTREYVSKALGETEVTRTTRNRSDTHGTSRSQTHGTSSSTSTSTSSTEGGSSGTTYTMGGSSGSSAGSFWNNAQNSSNNGSVSFNSGSNWSSTTSSSSSFSTNQSETMGENESQTEGISQGIHKRALLTPDEIGLLFGRVEEEDNPAYPGLALALPSGKRPIIVRRTNYFDDHAFERAFDPHPDHGFKPLPPKEPQPKLPPPPPNVRALLVEQYGPDTTNRVYDLIASIRREYPTLRHILDDQDDAAENILKSCESNIKRAAESGRPHTMSETLKICEEKLPHLLATDHKALKSFDITYGDEPQPAVKKDTDGIGWWIFGVIVVVGIIRAISG